MSTYKVPNLTAKTPQPEQTKLLAALKAVPGVASATLVPEKSEFNIQAQEKQQPKRNDIMSAATKAGFVPTR